MALFKILFFLSLLSTSCFAQVTWNGSVGANSSFGHAAVTAPQHIKDPGTLQEDFEDSTDWTASGAGASVADDSTNFKQTTQSVKLTSTSGNNALMEKTISEDLSGWTRMLLWVYVAEHDDLDTIKLRFSSTTDYSKYFEYSFDAGGVNDTTCNYQGIETKHVRVDGWNQLLVLKTDFTNTGAESWSNTMIRMRFEIDPNSTNTVDVSFDDMRLDHDAETVVIITFDDNNDTDFTKAFDYMKTKGMPGVLFVNSDNMDAVNRLTTAEAIEIQGQGWDVSNHTDDHSNLDGLAQATQEARINNGYTWLGSNGFTAARDIFAYPFGVYDDTSITVVKQNHQIARGTAAVHQPHMSETDTSWAMVIGSYPTKQEITPATIKSQIDDAITAKSLYVLYIHELLDGSPTSCSFKYNNADFQEVIDYIETKENAGDLDVMTFTEYLNYGTVSK